MTGTIKAKGTVTNLDVNPVAPALTPPERLSHRTTIRRGIFACPQ